MHQAGLVTLDEVGRPAVATEQLLQLLAGDTSEDRRVGDLVPVEVKDWEHRAVGDGIEKLVRVPGRRERSSLRLAVADHARDDEVRIVEHGSEGVAERIAQLAAFVDRARTLRGRVAWNSSGEGELKEELP